MSGACVGGACVRGRVVVGFSFIDIQYKLPARLHSSVRRASHRYRGGHGFESRFWALFVTVTS